MLRRRPIWEPVMPSASQMARSPSQPFSIARRRPLQTGDILLFFRAFLVPLEVIRYRNY